MAEKIDVESGNPYRDSSGHFGTSPNKALEDSFKALQGKKFVPKDGKKGSNKDLIVSKKAEAEEKLLALRGDSDSGRNPDNNIAPNIVDRFRKFSLTTQTDDTMSDSILDGDYKKALTQTRKDFQKLNGASGGSWTPLEEGDFIKRMSLKNKPVQKSANEYDKLKASGDYVVVYRNAGEKKYIDSFKNGENTNNPSHMFGDGVYFAVDEKFARGGEFAEGSSNDAVFEALIPKDRVTTYDMGDWARGDLSDAVNYRIKNTEGRERELALTAGDRGLISVLSGNAGFHVPANERYDDGQFSTEQFVILNPSHVIVKEEK